MSTFTVNTTDDIVDGNLNQLSLREAVQQANATTEADTIVFAGALSRARRWCSPAANWWSPTTSRSTATR